MPGQKRQPVQFNSPGLYEEDLVADIYEQVRVWPGGQLDLFTEKGVGLLDRLSIAGRHETLRGWSVHEAAQGQGQGRSEHDAPPSITHIKK